MTIKIQIVGTSHVAALRKGWEAISIRFPQVELGFFAANSTLFHLLELDSNLSFGIHDESKYLPRYAKFLRDGFGRIAVNLKESDAVVLVGKTTYEAEFLKNLGHYSVDGIRNLGSAPILSREAFNAFASAIYEKRRLAPEWRHWDSPKLFLTPPPAPSTKCPASNPRYASWAHFENQSMDNLSLLNAYREIVREKMLLDGVFALSPPSILVSPTGLTPSKYCAGAQKLPVGKGLKAANYEESDFHHMNAEYGSLALEKILNEVLKVLSQTLVNEGMKPGV